MSSMLLQAHHRVSAPAPLRPQAHQPCVQAACVHTPRRHQRHHRQAPVLHRLACRATNEYDLGEPKNRAEQAQPPEGEQGPDGEQLPQLGPRDDDVLPGDLADAISQAASATGEALRRGNARCQVEILLPTFWDPISGPIFPNKGDQERFWRITRRFVDELGDAYLEGGTSKALNAVYPDAGVAAMLSYQWKDDARFRFSSLNDRKPVKPEDELVIVVAPDPPGADECLRMIREVSAKEQEEGLPEKPIVLFNQRLASGDVGLGLNVRRMRNTILKDFAVTYSLRPLGFGEVGTVYRRYPGMWQVFLQDPELPGRYRLVAEKAFRPEGEYLDYLVQQAMGGPEDNKEGGEQGAGGFLGQLQRTANSLSYFMRSLSK